MRAIGNGRIITPVGIVENAALLFDKKIIGLVDADSVREQNDIEWIDAKGAYIAPGLVDMHIHGYLGEDTSDGKFEGLVTMAEGIAKNGVTSWLPTTMTVSVAEINAALDAVRALMKAGENEDFKGARALGVNAEGPFINPKKKGAQAETNILAPNAELIVNNADVIRIFTLAPEMPGALECIKTVKEKTSIAASIGHTNATYDEAKAGIAAGASHVTHLFNAQTPLAHRDPGVVGAALLSDVTTEMICDDFHINPAVYPLVRGMKGDKLVLITDCTRAGGLEDGEYTLGGQPIFVKGVECRLADGTIAGSVLKLNHAVRNFMNATGCPVWEAVNAASLTPARAIGVDDRKGSLEPGKDADIFLADDNFEVIATYIGGNKVYSA